MKKLLSATDEDITKAIDTLVAHPNCTGTHTRPLALDKTTADFQSSSLHPCRADWRHRNVLRRPLGIQGSSGLSRSPKRKPFSLPSHGICLQTALDPRCKAAVCYFATDIHSASLSPTGDDSLERASKGEIRGEVVMIFGTQDGHVVSSPISSPHERTRFRPGEIWASTDLPSGHWEPTAARGKEQDPERTDGQLRATSLAVVVPRAASESRFHSVRLVRRRFAGRLADPP